MFPFTSDSLPLKEIQKIQKKCKTVGLMIEGEIFFTQGDSKGNILLKDALDSNLCLQVLSKYLEDCIKNIVKEHEEKE
jgi:hypothetical protein